MNTKILIIIAIILFFGLGICAFFLLSKTSAPSTSTTPVGFPVASSTNASANTGSNTSGSGTGKAMTINEQGGAKIIVNDFVDNGVTVPDPSNVGKYYLTSFSSTEFAISYDASTQFFTIALQQEPIGHARLDAQQYLQQALGISQNQLCYLNYYLGTDDHTSDTYAGKNLGFSFCPGATALP